MKKPRVFLDSNIIIKGLLSQWTAARAVLVLCAAQNFKLVKPAEIAAAATIITHSHDAAVLAAAIRFKPDFLITNNRKHFSDQVTQATQLKIVSESEFFALLRV